MRDKSKVSSVFGRFVSLLFLFIGSKKVCKTYFLLPLTVDEPGYPPGAVITNVKGEKKNEQLYL